MEKIRQTNSVPRSIKNLGFLLAVLLVSAGAVYAVNAALTFSSTSVVSDGALTFTGAGASTWDIGANTLSLQTTNNGAITTGTGLLTVGGDLQVNGGDLLDTNGNEIFKMTATANAVNELTVANAAINTTPTITASGGDTNVGIGLTTKGTGALTMTLGDAAGLAQIATGNLSVGNGTPTTALNGEDAYIEGTFEVDGTAQFDNSVTLIQPTTTAVPLTITGATDSTVSMIKVNTIARGSNLVDIGWTNSATQTGNIAGVSVDMSNLTPSSGLTTYGIHVNDPSANFGGSEYGVYIQGSQWDYGLYVEDDIAIGQGSRIDFDADFDTSIRTSGDDVLEIEIAGADDFEFSANTFSLEAGSKIAHKSVTSGTHGVVFSLFGTIANTNTANKTMGIIPANANITNVRVVTTTAFNGGGNDFLDCGYTGGNPNEYINDLDLSAAGLVQIASPGIASSALGDVGGSDVTVLCVYFDQNGDSGAGAATVIIDYMID